jgi:hypothetical protein
LFLDEDGKCRQSELAVNRTNCGYVDVTLSFTIDTSPAFGHLLFCNSTEGVHKPAG